MAYTKKETKTINCGYCKKELKQRRSNQLFCNRRCKSYQKNKTKKRPYIKHKGSKCENCGFIPIHTCQLDVDHINGNKSDNRIENLRTLCSNCHRLKTFMNKDWEK